jgi:hypothetical protein
MLRASSQLGANAGEATEASNAVCAALNTHAGIAEVTAGNTDGGDRGFHGGPAEN